jgi:exopolysaccharide biosynthesis protein
VCTKKKLLLKKLSFSIKKSIIITIFLLLMFVVTVLFVKSMKINKSQTSPQHQSTGNTENSETEEKGSSIIYTHLSESNEGVKQEIHMLEIDIEQGQADIIPVLSHDLIFGHEILSSMAQRHNAYAAVNGGFFHEYGEPSGMVVINGNIITNSTGKYPVIIIDRNQAALQELNSRVWIKLNGIKFYIDGINTKGNPGDIILFSPVFGLSNRMEVNNTTAIIEDGIVERVVTSNSETDIPRNGFILTQLDLQENKWRDMQIGIGDSISYGIDPELGENAHAYECGSWVVRNGEVVIGQKDEWVGVLTNRDPRTVIGLKDSHKVVLVVVDGRQPGYSDGFSGRELGEFLVKHGINNAAMLDGGASTEMIVEGDVVNRPSFKNQERPLCGGIIVKLLK